MKTSNSFMKALSLGLAMCLVVGLYNCKPKETEPEVPNFGKEFENVKPLPAITQSTPAAVTTTPAKVEVSAAATAAATGLASGTVTAAVTSTATDMAKAVSPEKATSIAAAFTPAVLTTLSSGGALPASLQADINALKSNAALAAYLPKVTAPTVNGAPVSLLIEKGDNNNAESLPLSYPSFVTTGVSSECTDASDAAYAAAKKILDDSKIAQDKLVNDTYNTAAAAVSSTSCKSTVTAGLTANLAAAKTVLDAGIAGVSKMITDKTVTEANGALLKAFAYSNYAISVEAFKTSADQGTKACDAEGTAKIAALKAVQTKDLGTIKTAYDAAVAPLKAINEANIKKCHDQGQGN